MLYTVALVHVLDSTATHMYTCTFLHRLTAYSLYAAVSVGLQVSIYM